MTPHHETPFVLRTQPTTTTGPLFKKLSPCVCTVFNLKVCNWVLSLESKRNLAYLRSYLWSSLIRNQLWGPISARPRVEENNSLTASDESRDFWRTPKIIVIKPEPCAHLWVPIMQIRDPRRHCQRAFGIENANALLCCVCLFIPTFFAVGRCRRRRRLNHVSRVPDLVEADHQM